MAYDPLGDLILFLSMYAHIRWLVTQYQRAMSYSQWSDSEREYVCMSGNVLSKRGLKHCVGCLPSKDPVSFVPLYATTAESFGQALVTSVLCSCLFCCHCSQHLCEIYNCNKMTCTHMDWPKNSATYRRSTAVFPTARGGTASKCRDRQRNCSRKDTGSPERGNQP